METTATEPTATDNSSGQVVPDGINPAFAKGEEPKTENKPKAPSEKKETEQEKM